MVLPARGTWRVLRPLPVSDARAGLKYRCRRRQQHRYAGLRDYAVLSLLARLGLRGVEAAGLQLGDVDWRAGEVAVTGKGSRTERLSLPAPAGEALAAWLTGGRPRCE
jgi:site-specific recombinase XerC